MKRKLDTRLKDIERGELTGKTTSMMTRRYALVDCPWSEDPYGFYMKCFPTEVHAAMDAIEQGFDGKFANIINRDKEAILLVRCGSDDPRVQIKFGKERPCIPAGWRDDVGLTIKPAHPAHSALVQFVTEWETIKGQLVDVSNMVGHVVETCNTFGQIHRVWPDLLPTIGGIKVQAAENQLRKSSLPHSLRVDDIMRVRDKYTFMLAQGALLPDRDLTTEVLCD